MQYNNTLGQDTLLIATPEVNSLVSSLEGALIDLNSLTFGQGKTDTLLWAPTYYIPYFIEPSFSF